MNAVTGIDAAQRVNGIDVGAVQALAGGIASDSATGMTGWKVATRWQGQTWSRSTVEGYTLGGRHIARPFAIDIDEPQELGGQNRFPNPQEYLLAALNACMTVGYAAQCALRGIALESLEIETEGNIDLRGFLGLAEVAPGYESLTYTVRIKGDGTDAQFAEVHAAVMATSPNFHNLARAVTLEPKLVVG